MKVSDNYFKNFTFLKINFTFFSASFQSKVISCDNSSK